MQTKSVLSLGLFSNKTFPLLGHGINHCSNVGHILETTTESIRNGTIVTGRHNFPSHPHLVRVLGVRSEKVFGKKIFEEEKIA